MKKQIDYKRYLASREWRVKRKEVIELARGICGRCGSRPIQNVHHLTYENLGSENPKTDLLGVCHPCHEFLAAEREDDPALDAIINAVAGGLFPSKGWSEEKDFTRTRFIGGASDCGLSLRVVFASKDEYMRYASWLPKIEVGPGVMAIFDWI